MENASKALVLAGGVLLAMMILVMLIYVGTSMTDNMESQERNNLAKQITEFNKTYLAYDKTKMFGIDVITVANKAINHNKTIEAEDTDPYYINIVVKTKNDFKTTGIVVDNSYPSNHIRHERDLDSQDIKDLTGNDVVVALEHNYINGHNLGTWSSDGTLEMNNGIIKFFEQYKEDKQIRNNNKTYYVYSALTNFKKAIFMCESVEYNEETGRINSMTFKQI